MNNTSKLSKKEVKRLKKQNSQPTTYGQLAKTSYGNLSINKLNGVK